MIKNDETMMEYLKANLPIECIPSAFRFYEYVKVPLDCLVEKFKKWQRYVVPYNNIDVDKISYDEFDRLISKGQLDSSIHAIIYKDDDVMIGTLNNLENSFQTPFRYNDKIRLKRWFDKYNKLGFQIYELYYFHETCDKTYFIAAVKNDKIEINL
jgi:hypothetical protein